ncbi:hypothetical protein AB0D27_44550 [Streptomyces sp. NPDC048415]|uniref:hypothetical protein n=1 Tax=Streptomyces sp. NPDC048415 TaxID=3154822 RepID=UPI003416CD1C
MGDWRTTGRRRPRALPPLREHLRDTFWCAPAHRGDGAGLRRVGGASETDAEIIEALQKAHDYDGASELLRLADDARAVVTAVS